MIDIISKRREESGFGEGRGEREGMLGGARVKLIQCRVNSLGETDPPQLARGTDTETHSEGLRGQTDSTRFQYTRKDMEKKSSVKKKRTEKTLRKPYSAIAMI